MFISLSFSHDKFTNPICTLLLSNHVDISGTFFYLFVKILLANPNKTTSPFHPGLLHLLNTNMYVANFVIICFLEAHRIVPVHFS